MLRLYPSISMPTFRSLISPATSFINMLKSMGDNTQPYLTPCSTLNFLSLDCLLKVSRKHSHTYFLQHYTYTYLCQYFSTFLLMVSNAFCMSTKHTKVDCLLLYIFSIVEISEKMWSRQLLIFLKPFCSWTKMLLYSIDLVNLNFTIVQ